ncbi:MAG: hypothetical protein WA125_03385 [Desulfosporosinus sp.]
MYGYGRGCCAPVSPVGTCVGVGIIAIAILILIALGVIFQVVKQGSILDPGF